ncbi:MAG: hypothetical protein ABSF94_04715 [Steroidobacteraceae bacterium]|jgi:hypothetical protein
MNLTRHVHRFAADLVPVVGWALRLRHILTTPALGVALMGALST